MSFANSQSSSRPHTRSWSTMLDDVSALRCNALHRSIPYRRESIRARSHLHATYCRRHSRRCDRGHKKTRSYQMTDGLNVSSWLGCTRRAWHTKVIPIELACTRIAGRSLPHHVEFSITSLRKISDGGITVLWTTSKLPAKRTSSAINGVSPFASTYSGSL